MNTITIDLSECFYYLVPFFIIWYITYRTVKKVTVGLFDNILLVPISVIALGITAIYFIILDVILSHNFNIQL